MTSRLHGDPVGYYNRAVNESQSPGWEERVEMAWLRPHG